MGDFLFVRAIWNDIGTLIDKSDPGNAWVADQTRAANFTQPAFFGALRIALDFAGCTTSMPPSNQEYRRQHRVR